MGSPTRPEPEITKEVWRQYMLNARAALHANPQDQEARQAIEDAMQAINALEQPTPEPTLGQSVVGGFKGLVNVGQSAIEGIPDLFKAGVLHDPEAMYRSGEGIVRTVTGPVDVTLRAMREGNVTPEEASQAFGGFAAMAAPLLKGVPAPGPIRSLSAPFRAAGEVLRRPELRNLETEANIANTEANTQTAAARRLAIMQRAMMQAGREPARLQAMAKRLEILQQQIERGPATAENLNLRNEILRMRLEMMGEGGPGEAGSTGARPNPSQPRPGGPGVNIPEAEFTVETPGTVPMGPMNLPGMPRALLGNVAEGTAPDMLRTLPDEALGQTPPFEQSAANPAAFQALIEELARRLSQKGRP